jgi:hypothetical protein
MRLLTIRRSRALAGLLAGASLVIAFGGATVVAAPKVNPGADIAAVRQATNKYRDLNAALADGYVPFYVCTEEPGIGTMGQHYVKLSLVGDPNEDPLQPEALVYVPTPNGGHRLVAAEWVVFASVWQGAYGNTTPTILGQPMLFRPAGNRFGLPDFYERHAWLWQGNPDGMFADWNPNVSCLGTGDNGG